MKVRFEFFFIFFIVLFFTGTAALAATTTKPGTKPATPPLEVSGWIPYWRTATGTTDALAHLSSFTEINPFGYTVKTDGTLYDAMGIDQAPWTTLILAAKARKIRVVPTVMWSNREAIHAILSRTTQRIALEDRITTLVQTEGFDGIDIDFENKDSKTRPYFSLFLKGLHARMGKKWVMCDIEPRTPLSSRYDGTPPADATDYANDYVAINKYCDRVRIMAYDQGAIDLKLNEANEGPYVPLADPKWVEKVVNVTAQTISKKKITIGIPTYGYEYQVTPLQSGYRYEFQWAFNPGYANELISKFNLTPVRNSAGELYLSYQPQSNTPMVPIQTTPAENNLLTPPVSVFQAAAPVESHSQQTPTYNIAWWSDSQAVADKIALAKKLGVRGVSIFKIDGGEDPNIWSVLPKKK